LYIADNKLRCDCHLAWLLQLQQRTASLHVRAALDAVQCLMEAGAATAQSDASPATVRLASLKASELPCDRPLAEEPAAKEQKPSQRPPAPVEVHQKLFPQTEAVPPPQRTRAAQTSAQVTTQLPEPTQVKVTKSEVKVTEGGVRASEDEVKDKAASVRDRGNGAAAVAGQLSVMVLLAVLAVAR